ncbi:hypothetical protein A3Q29_21340 [Providencia stuartii]|uniref:Uncharacterized protein n=1 Tax=Providencia stuartii TaxID=588 RepID=A0A1S1HP69_PROST|nr:hypothetical protein A3Q29_21340 [Providencia stuartii]
MKTPCNTEMNFAHRPAIIVMDNPLKAKEARRFKVMMVILMFVVLGIALFSQQVFLPKIKQAEAQFTHDMMKPQMMRLAEQGKVPARLWLAEYYPDAHTEATLDALVVEGNAQAMMLKALLVYPTNKALSLSFIRRAAQEGEPRAVKFVADIQSGDITLSDFMSHDMFQGDH